VGIPGSRDMRINLAGAAPKPFPQWARRDPCGRAAPKAKAPGIGMALLQMINLQHHREPYLARRGVRRRALVREAGLIVALKARNPQVDRGTGDLQPLTDTALTPALRIEGDDLPAGLGALGMAVA